MKNDYIYIDLCFLKNEDIKEISLMNGYFYITTIENKHLKVKQDGLMVRKVWY